MQVFAPMVRLNNLIFFYFTFNFKFWNLHRMLYMAYICVGHILGHLSPHFSCEYMDNGWTHFYASLSQLELYRAELDWWFTDSLLS